jgi:hypothetical protein
VKISIGAIRKAAGLASREDWANFLKYGGMRGTIKFRRGPAPTTTREQVMQAKRQGFNSGDMSAEDMERMIRGGR